MGGAAVADPHAALQQRGGGLAELEDQADRIVEELIVGALVGAFCVELAALVVLRCVEEALDVLGVALRLPEGDDAGDFLFRDKGGVHADQARGAWRQEEHVAAAEQRLGAVRVEDGARVGLGGQAEAHAGRHVGLDEAGDHVDRRPLRREDEVDADRARHLREAGDGFFDVRLIKHHQVG